MQTGDVARMVDVPEYTLDRWVARGWVHPGRRGKAYDWSEFDLRIAQALASAQRAGCHQTTVWRIARMMASACSEFESPKRRVLIDPPPQRLMEPIDRPTVVVWTGRRDA
jgi:DNA-binding transcriptional MerR regulator